jgi:hypothetical protein
MNFFDHPIAEKAIAGVAVAFAVWVGGSQLSDRERLAKHDAQIEQIVEMRKDVGDIKHSLKRVEQDVAVLKDREERKDVRH